MSELFHNLSMQALSIDDDSVEIQFIHLTTLCRSIGNLLRNNMALIPHKKPPTYLEHTPPRFTPYKNKNQMLEEEVVKNKLSKKKIRYPRDSGYMSFPNTPEEILEQRKKKREAAMRISFVMSPYEKEHFSDITDVAKKEMKDTIEEVKSEAAIAEINSILEKKEGSSKTDDREVVNEIKEDSVEILSRIDKSRRIVPQAETEPSLPSLTDLVVSSPAADFVLCTSPDGKLTVRQSKRLLEKEKKNK